MFIASVPGKSVLAPTANFRHKAVDQRFLHRPIFRVVLLQVVEQEGQRVHVAARGDFHRRQCQFLIGGFCTEQRCTSLVRAFSVLSFVSRISS